MADLLVDAFLEHVGVKGMKWGVRRDDSSGSSGAGSSSSSGSAGSAPSGSAGGSGKPLSRKEVRVANKIGKQNYDGQKVTDVYNESKTKGEQVLVKSKAADGIQTIMTGKQFVEHIEAGGMVDGGSTRIFARQAKAGEQFVMNAFETEQYIPIKRK